ncbi:DUF7832 domain-containing protein [Sphingobacterium sp.]|uniref:DUF7832 domain-containing protein n=1 Tax=Sphingobacterium sp. TaxID=341027 RepID=UPI002FDA4EE3
MTYDRIDWHSGGDFPPDLKPENGGTHIGMFLCWAIQNDLIGALHRELSQKSLEKVKERNMTGRDFLIEECDSKFIDEDLNVEGNMFAKYYYGDETYKEYLNDYADIFDPYETLYHVEDTWGNYDKIKPVIDKNYQEWKTISADL